MPLDLSQSIPKRPRLLSEAYLGCQRYSITCTTHNRQPIFIARDIFEIMRQYLGEVAAKAQFRVWVFCFMPDHLHLLLEGKKAESDLQQYMKLFKQRSGYWYQQNTGQRLWSTSYFDHVLRKEEDTIVVVKYILANPERAGLVKSWYKYPYSGSFELNTKDLL